MTDYRNVQTPPLATPRSYGQQRRAQDNGALGGVLIALALIGLGLLGLSIFFAGGNSDQPVASGASQTETRPISPAIDPTTPSPTQ